MERYGRLVKVTDPMTSGLPTFRQVGAPDDMFLYADGFSQFFS